MKKIEDIYAHRRQTKRYDITKVDKITVRMPKGTKEKIAKYGYSYNSFINAAIREKLAELEAYGEDMG